MAATHKSRQTRAKTQTAEANARAAEARASSAERSERQAADKEAAAGRAAQIRPVTTVIDAAGSGAKQTVNAIPGGAFAVFFLLMGLWIWTSKNGLQAFATAWAVLTSGKPFLAAPSTQIPAGTAAPSPSAVPGRLTPTAPSF